MKSFTINFRHKHGKERAEALKGALCNEDVHLLKSTINDELELADTLIENAVGYFQLPFALVPGLTINDHNYPLIPLVTEETSVVAAEEEKTEVSEENV